MTIGQLFGLTPQTPPPDPQQVETEAKRLYQRGWRLFGWGFPLTDTNLTTALMKAGEVVDYWEDGRKRRTEEAIEIMAILGEPDFQRAVCRRLNELSATDVEALREVGLSSCFEPERYAALRRDPESCRTAVLAETCLS
jgi:hypothetical protein